MRAFPAPARRRGRSPPDARRRGPNHRRPAPQGHLRHPPGRCGRSPPPPAVPGDYLPPPRGRTAPATRRPGRSLPVIAGDFRLPPVITARRPRRSPSRPGPCGPSPPAVLPFLTTSRWLVLNLIRLVLFSFCLLFFSSNIKGFIKRKSRRLFSKIIEPNIPTRVHSYFCNPEFAGFLKIRRFSHSL